MKENYKKLRGTLPITVEGFLGFFKQTDVFTVETYLEIKDPYYSEFVIIPDGRIIPAEPSHSSVLDSLLNFLNDGKWFLSISWLVEERLYYTGAIQCWDNFQNSFSHPTKEQQITLDKLVKYGVIKPNSHKFYSIEKQNYFLSIKDKIHEEALSKQNQHGIKDDLLEDLILSVEDLFTEKS